MLSSICLALPNFIEGLCDSVFSDVDERGMYLSNLKTKLCKAVGYGSTLQYSLPLKIAGEMILLLDDEATKKIIDTVGDQNLLVQKPSDNSRPLTETRKLMNKPLIEFYD